MVTTRPAGRTPVPDPVVTVGAGQTAAVAARSLRTAGFDGRIVMVGDEQHLPYQRPPLSKGYLVGSDDRTDLPILTAQWCAEHAVELRLGTRARRIDPATRTVELDDGDRLAAGGVLLATGGRPRRLPDTRSPGTAHPDRSDRVLVLRTIEDADRIRGLLGAGRHLVVVGAGFIGSEVAAAARTLGTDVTIIEALDVPFAPLLGRRMGTALAGLHGDGGTALRTGETVEGIEESAHGVAVTTSSGATVEGDAVVVGIGIVPAVEVADASGIATGDGVLVDAHCRTSVPGVVAAGDVANHYHPLFERRLRVEHFDNANRQGAVAARTLLGDEVVLDTPHWFWSDQYGHNIQYAGDAPSADHLVVRGSVEARDFIAFYLRGPVLVAALAVDRGRAMAVTRRLIARRARPDPAVLTDEQVGLRSLLDDDSRDNDDTGSHP